MSMILQRIFPKTISSEYSGSRIAYWFFVLLSIVSFGRSLIHFLAPDGGAGTIAGLDLSLGKENIVFAFGLWGLSQAIYAFIQLLIAFKYKNLIPLMYVILILETLGRMFVGIIKPPILFHTPPGGTANYIILPLAIIMLIWELLPQKKKQN